MKNKPECSSFLVRTCAATEYSSYDSNEVEFSMQAGRSLIGLSPSAVPVMIVYQTL